MFSVSEEGKGEAGGDVLSVAWLTKVQYPSGALRELTILY